MALSVPDGNDAKESVGVTAGGQTIEWIRKERERLRAEADVKLDENWKERLRLQADVKQRQKEYEQWLELLRTTEQSVYDLNAQIAKLDGERDRIFDELQSDLKKMDASVLVCVFYVLIIYTQFRAGLIASESE